MCDGAVYPALLARRTPAPTSGLSNVVAASAEGYPFPTNLDLDQPVDGLAPQSQAELVRRAAGERWSPDDRRRAGGTAERRRGRLADGRDLMGLLDDKVVLVSGGTQGVGRGHRPRRGPRGRDRGRQRSPRRSRAKRSSPS